MTEKKTLPVPYKPPFPRWVWVAFWCLAIGACVGAMTSCAGLPRTVYVPDGQGGVVERTEIPHYAPGTDLELYTTSPAGEAGGTDWLDIALTAAGVLFGVGQLTPRGLKNWATVLSPSTSWKDTGKALAANVVGVHSPKPPAEPAPS